MKQYEITLTEEELELVRSALCLKSMKVLLHAQEVEKEEREKGLGNEMSRIHYDLRDEVKAIINKIDELEVEG